MEKELSILLVGAGNIGRRYLEGLAKSKIKMNVEILDISQDSLLLAKKVFYSFQNQNYLSVNFKDSIEKINNRT